MGVSSFSQTGYPRKVVKGADTVIEITPGQLDTINMSLVSLDECDSTQKVLLSDIGDAKKAMSLYEKDIVLYKEKVAMRDASITERDNIITTATNTIQGMGKDIERLKSRCRVLGISTGALIVLAGYFLLL